MSIEVKDTAPVSEQQIRQLVDLFSDKVRADRITLMQRSAF